MADIVVVWVFFLLFTIAASVQIGVIVTSWILAWREARRVRSVVKPCHTEGGE